tara:strand:- start:2146 stop:4611 length:2466 start_codon:yes stop_codon:yes gene_type:complete
MKQFFTKTRAIVSLILFLSINNTFAQLSLISDQNIDFSTAVSTISSGNWSDAGIWSNGVVPTATTDVIIENNHVVYIDIEGSSSGEIVDISRNLQIKPLAILRMGHDTSGFAKDLRINGSILCNGTFSAGREQPVTSGDGSVYQFNSRIYLKLNQQDTYISGSGYFHPRSLSISSDSEDNNLIIDIYNMVIDDNFAIKSDNRVNAIIKYNSYVHIKKTLGLTGSIFQFSSPTAKANLTIEGIVIANDISLFTRNTTAGESSSITIANKGSLFIEKINDDVLNIASEAAGFNFTIQEGGLFRISKNSFFNNLTQSNPHFNFTNNGQLKRHYSYTMPSKSEITASIDANDPNEGVDVSQIKEVFGASHIAGWYNFTDRPFMLEGLDFYKEFGATSIKTTVSAVNGKMSSAYPFNHTWPNFQTIKDVTQYKHLDSLFKRAHIKTHTFWTTTKNQGDWKKGPDFDHESFLNEEQQFYDLTKYLLETYGHLDKKFIYQNWEGDWMLRGQGVQWENDPSLIPGDINWLTEGMARMFRVRQRGVERARNEFQNSTAKVYHGIEFNKLWLTINGNKILTMEHGTPSVLENVIPHTRIDLSSWSSYDSSWENTDNPHGHAMWKGLEVANYFTTDTQQIENGIPVQIGEFAINENPPYNGNNTESVIRDRYGRYIGVALGLGIPNFYVWNLYCSGQQGGPAGFEWEKGVQYDTSFLYEWMDGKWMVEPDESWGFAAGFLMEQWANTLSDADFIDPQKNITLYPNPTNNFIHIKGVENNTDIFIYDINGKIIKKINDVKDKRIDISNLKSGTYFVKIYNHNQKSTYRKLILY